jgi:chemotaxis protein methyltransferase CheR
MEMDLYHHVKQTIWNILQIDLDCYKDEHMRHRLDAWLLRSGAQDWNEYFRRMRCDVLELSRFRDYLTINVSSFFRDLDRWKCLEELLASELLCETRKSNWGGLNFWSAGCSIGAEPYSLAILLEELTPSRRHHILATDLDRGALSRSLRRGPYSAEEVKNISHSYRDGYLERGGPPFFVQESLARKVEFREHNLLEDPFPARMDLIVCRNVVIYFTEETQVQVYRKFHASLRPGGILFVGETERTPRLREMGYRRIGPSFYQKEWERIGTKIDTVDDR